MEKVRSKRGRHDDKAELTCPFRHSLMDWRLASGCSIARMPSKQHCKEDILSRDGCSIPLTADFKTKTTPKTKT